MQYQMTMFDMFVVWAIASMLIGLIGFLGYVVLRDCWKKRAYWWHWISVWFRTDSVRSGDSSDGEIILPERANPHRDEPNDSGTPDEHASRQDPLDK